MNKVFIVYILHADGSMDLDKVFSTKEKAETYVDSYKDSKSYEIYYEEVEVE